MNGGSLKRHDTVAKGPWVWGLCSLDSGPGVGGANVSCRASRAAPRAPLDAPTREASALHTRAQAPSAPRPSRWRRITVRKYAPRHQSVYRPVCSAATQGAMRVSPLDKALEAPHVWARASCSSGPVNRDRLPRGRQTRPELLRVMLALWVVRSPDRCPASPQRQRLRACCQS
jgi:hypothetical protein